MEPVKTIILVRHGQYDPEIKRNEKLGSSLTEIGRKQAELTGEYLSKYPIKRISSSSMLRAKETAEIISGKLGNVKVKPTKQLWEQYPPIHGLFIEHMEKVSPEMISSSLEIMESTFRKHFTPPEKNKSSVELLVTHGNLIRYLVCRSLQVSIYSWMHMHIYNCSITQIEVNQYGESCLAEYNNLSHIPEELKTDNLENVGIIPKD